MWLGLIALCRACVCARVLCVCVCRYSTFWAPVINLAREPRWGRNLETPGEDPYHVGQYAIHYTQGMQTSPDDPRYLQASACCKHYVLNSMEVRGLVFLSFR